MKMVICKNCGGSFSDETDRCPYCGTMHKKGAYAKFRRKVSDVIDRLLGLKVEAERSVSRIILSSILRALVLCAVCIGLALAVSLASNTNYYNDKSYDERRLKDIEWENENISKLDEAYAKGDFETIEKLYDQNSSSVYKWQHYPAYYLKVIYGNIMQYVEDGVDEYGLEDALYYLFFPEYYAQTGMMSEEEKEEFEHMKREVIDVFAGYGYSEDRMRTIYDSIKDDYGYIRLSDLKDYLKGEN